MRGRVSVRVQSSSMSVESTAVDRAALHAALSDSHRVGAVDLLRLGDRTPAELRLELGIDSNLMSHHLRVLEQVRLVERRASQGDARRRYVRLLVDRLQDVVPPLHRVGGDRVVFVCTGNSARSQLAAAMWQRRTGSAGVSAGAHPAEAVHPRAVRAARRAGLDLSGARPQGYDALGDEPLDVVVSVCDRAREGVPPPARLHLHWSVPDPVPIDDDAAFDAVVAELEPRIALLANAVGIPGGSA